MRLVYAIFIGLLFIGPGTLPSAEAQECDLRGDAAKCDINDDCALTVVDTLILLNEAVMIDTGFCPEHPAVCQGKDCCDLNRDKRISVLDVQISLNEAVLIDTDFCDSVGGGDEDADSDDDSEG